MAKPLVIIGAGGHAAVLAELLLTEGRQIIAVVSPEPIHASSPLADIKRLVSDEELLAVYPAGQIELVNGIGSLPGKIVRWQLFEFFSERGYCFASVISPAAILSKHLVLEQGVQVMAGVVLQTNVHIGVNSIINTGAIIDHGCKIGTHNHIAPGVTLSGGVITGNQVHIGTGASVIQGIQIESYAVIGAGATIVRDVTVRQVIVPAANHILIKGKK